jgi:DNA invertase Pin-like site-specific DNA recombinase
MPVESTARNAVESGHHKRSVRLLRVSTPRQLGRDHNPEGLSIPTQRENCIRKEAELGAINVGEYIEPGKSAKSMTKRPTFQKLLKRIREERDVDYVIIDMSSRMIRNWMESGALYLELDALGVRLVHASENINGDTAIDEAMRGMLAVFNGFQSRANGEDIRRKMTTKADHGGTNYQAPLGYLNIRDISQGRDDRTVIIDPERGPLIRLAFELYATGLHTIESITDKLEELGLRTRGTKRYPPRPVSRSKVATILRDRYYVGYTYWSGVEREGRHEPLISMELFEQVQRVMDARSQAGTRQRRHNHHLKGIIWCQRCKRRFIVMPGNGNGGQYFYFLCRGRQDHDRPALRHRDLLRDLP